MFSNKMLIFTVVLTVLVIAVASSSSSGSRSYNYDLSGAALTRLYNSPVYTAERMKRPMKGFPRWIKHAGVRVTLEDGAMWLVHKGNAFGIDSDTVVVDARHMSSEWEIVETKDFQGTKTVSDFVAAGGSDYNLIFDNCLISANRMMRQ